MDRVKYIWRGLITLKDGLALLALLLFFGGLFFLLSSSSDPDDKRGGALLVSLDGVVVEQPEDVDPLSLIQGDVPNFSQYRAADVVRSIRLAAAEKRMKVIVLNLDGFIGGGQVSLQDIGRAMDVARAAKIPVLTYATAYSDDAYLLAAHASEVWLNPMGAVMLAGPGGTRPYFKGLIDRFGVNVHVYRVGKYKSFVEPYTHEHQSEEAKAADQALVNSLWEDWQAEVAKLRPKAELASMLKDPAAAANGENLASTALRFKLVDKLGDDIAFGTHLAKIVGGDEDLGPGDFNRTTMDALLENHPLESRGKGVGLVTIAGEIVDGSAGSGTAAGDSVSALINEALTDDDIKALVVRVDSPGGSVMASEKIRLALAEAHKAKIPVIVSMGNVAASGGYWVSMAADKIFAEPATVTGSIGVFAIIPSFERTMARYGVNADGVKTTPLSGQPDVFGGTTPEADHLLQAGTDDIYRRFTTLVAKRRNLPLARVQEIAQGRVWDGGSARQLGLIDAFGSLDDAVAEAAKRAGLNDVKVRRFEPQSGQGMLGWLLGNFGIHAKSSVARDWVSLLSRKREAQFMAGVSDGLNIISGPSVQVRCIGCPATQFRAGLRVPKHDFINRIIK